jgi:uncharacterized protein YndB with AHSA1/START domain
MNESQKHSQTFVYMIYIKTTAEKLWQALTEGDFSEKYWMGFRIQSEWKTGSPIYVRNPGFLEGKGDITGTVLACDPPRVLTYTFGNAMDPLAAERQGPSRVTYELAPVGEMVKLTLTHENLLPQDLGEKTLTLRGVNNGWPALLSGLKSLLEAGQALDFTALLEEFKPKAAR